MKLGIPRESLPDERRVAATPDSVKKLVKLGFDVVVEHDAGLAAGFDDASYTEAGAVMGDRARAWSCEVLAKVRPPVDDEVGRLAAGQTIISFLYPAFNQDLVAKLASRGRKCDRHGSGATHHSEPRRSMRSRRRRT